MEDQPAADIEAPDLEHPGPARPDRDRAAPAAPSVSIPPAARAELEPTCPRCGYNQRGVVSQWADTCPLDGRCTECGLAFQWAEVFLGREAPGWSIESPHRSGAFRVAIGWAHTLIRAASPWTFWGRVRLSHEVLHARLAAFVLLTAAFVWVMFATQSATLAMLEGYSPSQGVHVALFPLSTQPIDGGNPWAAAGARWRMNTPIDYATQVLARVGSFAFLGLIYFAAGLLVFILLPFSRRRAKVRWAHIGRIAAYGMVLPALLVVLGWVSIFAPNAIITQRSPWMILIAVMIYGYVLWWASIRRYLRIPNAWAIALSMACFGVLIPPVVALFSGALV